MRRRRKVAETPATFFPAGVLSSAADELFLAAAPRPDLGRRRPHRHGPDRPATRLHRPRPVLALARPRRRDRLRSLHGPGARGARSPGGSAGRGPSAATTRTTSSAPTTSRPSSCSGGRSPPTSRRSDIYEDYKQVLARDGHRPRRPGRARARRGPGQRRPGAPRRVLPRLDGDAGPARLRLRHPLRVRHLRAGIRNGAPGRARRRVAALRQPVGDRPARVHGAGAASAGTPSTSATATAASRAGWRGAETVLGVPYDTPIAGYGTNTVNTLRLWAARASEEFDLRPLQRRRLRARGGRARTTPRSSPRCSTPTTTSRPARSCGCKQEYFFVACSIADIVRRYLARRTPDFAHFAEKVAIQLNDTHPAIAIAELMRVLVDEYARRLGRRLGDHPARPSAYTNHTLLARGAGALAA